MRYTRTRIASRPSIAIQRYTALYTIQLYSYTALYTLQPLQHPSLVVALELYAQGQAQLGGVVGGGRAAALTRESPTVYQRGVVEVV